MITTMGLFGIYILLHVLVTLPALRTRFHKTCSILIPVFLALDSLLAGILILEFYFAKIHDQSDGFNLTYAGKTWFERHWKPLNSLGYRDAEFVPPKPGQKSLVVLGDSFAAGHGVNRSEDLFSSVAASVLGQEWKVFNVSKIGWDTVDETKALKSFPVKPDVVALAYVLNDIYHAAQEENFPLRFGVNLPRGFMKVLTEHSALADYIYWRFARGGNLSGGAATFWETLQGAYGDPKVWARHEDELSDLAAYCRERGIKLIVIVFPMLQAPAESASLTGKVLGVFEKRGVTVMDLTPVLSGRPVRELVVNPLDAHPNEAVHREVGELLARRLQSVDMSKSP